MFKSCCYFLAVLSVIFVRNGSGTSIFPKRCQSSFSCQLASKIGEILKQSDFDNFPNLRVIHDTTPQSTILSNFSFIISEPYQFQVQKIICNANVFIRSGRFFKSFREDDLYPQPIFVNYKKQKANASFQNCLEDHCLMSNAVKTLKCQNFELNNFSFTDNNEIMKTCIKRVTYLDLSYSYITGAKYSHNYFPSILTLNLENAEIAPESLLIKIVEFFSSVIRIQLSDSFSQNQIQKLIEKQTYLSEIETDSVFYWPYNYEFVEIFSKTNACHSTVSITNFDHVLKLSDCPQNDTKTSSYFDRTIFKVKQALVTIENHMLEYKALIVLTQIPFALFIMVYAYYFSNRAKITHKSDSHLSVNENIYTITY